MDIYAILLFVAIANLVVLAITAWSPNPTGVKAMKVVKFSTIIGLILIITNVMIFPVSTDGSTITSIQR